MGLEEDLRKQREYEEQRASQKTRPDTDWYKYYADKRYEAHRKAISDTSTFVRESVIAVSLLDKLHEFGYPEYLKKIGTWRLLIYPVIFMSVDPGTLDFTPSGTEETELLNKKNEAKLAIAQRANPLGSWSYRDFASQPTNLVIVSGQPEPARLGFWARLFDFYMDPTGRSKPEPQRPIEVREVTVRFRFFWNDKDRDGVVRKTELVPTGRTKSYGNIINGVSVFKEYHKLTTIRNRYFEARVVSPQQAIITGASIYERIDLSDTNKFDDLLGQASRSPLLTEYVSTSEDTQFIDTGGKWNDTPQYSD